MFWVGQVGKKRNPAREILFVIALRYFRDVCVCVNHRGTRAHTKGETSKH